MIPVCFIAHTFFFPRFFGMIYSRGEKKRNPFLFKISALKTPGKQNNLYLLPLVSDKYLKGLGSSPTGKRQ